MRLSRRAVGPVLGTTDNGVCKGLGLGLGHTCPPHQSLPAEGPHTAEAAVHSPDRAGELSAQELSFSTRPASGRLQASGVSGPSTFFPKESALVTLRFGPCSCRWPLDGAGQPVWGWRLLQQAVTSLRVELDRASGLRGSHFLSSRAWVCAGKGALAQETVLFSPEFPNFLGEKAAENSFHFKLLWPRKLLDSGQKSPQQVLGLFPLSRPPLLLPCRFKDPGA